ncbi:MAG: SDR family oxidoreductase [SAR324 cluster bacterium]|nr:SDR family oxidoreductase [SAR324 cluster bacterium]
MNKKNILITGGAGFLGSYLCKRHLDAGHHVICLDNLQTGNINNIKPFMDNPEFEFVEQDVIDPFDAPVDQIFNFACPASPPLYQADPIHTFRTSVEGIMNMVKLAKKYNARLMQASTSEVYGDPAMSPQVESYWGNVNPIGIRSCYDEGKRSAETLMMDYHRTENLDIKIVRIFNTYGPSMNHDDGRVVSNFVVQALRGEDITIYGSGNQSRSFCFVEDLVDVIISMMNSEDFIGPVNIGNPGEFTMLELADKVIAKTGSKSKKVFMDLPQDDPTQRCPDISLASEKLGWEPKVKLDEGLDKTIAYFDSWLQAND